jgi:hypothetical protein
VSDARAKVSSRPDLNLHGSPRTKNAPSPNRWRPVAHHGRRGGLPVLG